MAAFQKLDVEKLRQEIETRFEQTGVVEEKPKVTTEQAAEILFRVALRKPER